MNDDHEDRLDIIAKLSRAIARVKGYLQELPEGEDDLINCDIE